MTVNPYTPQPEDYRPNPNTQIIYASFFSNIRTQLRGQSAYIHGSQTIIDVTQNFDSRKAALKGLETSLNDTSSFLH